MKINTLQIINPISALENSNAEMTKKLLFE